MNYKFTLSGDVRKMLPITWAKEQSHLAEVISEQQLLERNAYSPAAYHTSRSDLIGTALSAPGCELYSFSLVFCLSLEYICCLGNRTKLMWLQLGQTDHNKTIWSMYWLLPSQLCKINSQLPFSFSPWERNLFIHFLLFLFEDNNHKILVLASRLQSDLKWHF